ncbi:amino acid adenylation domain-containing protein [Streptomyces sp. NPDC050256]|uniref:non-ribosomal peptide synthetase n=1 Tax=unclassified Streptomyces TaxID=2593676 RepID=UPI0037AD2E78
MTALPPSPADAVPEAEYLPASGTQAGLWFINQTQPDVPLYMVPLVLRLTGAIDAEAARQVLHALPVRHDALGLRFTAGAQGAALLPAGGDPNVSILDLRDSADPEAAWAAVLQEHLLLAHDLGRETGYRAVFASLGDHRHMLGLFLHHAYMDARSAEVILDYLVSELGSGAVPEGESVPYRRIAEWLQAAADGNEPEASRAYWRRELSDAADFRLPTDHDRPVNRSFAAKGLRRPLPAGFLARLERFCRAERTTPFMVLAAVYATSLATWAGEAEGGDPLMSVPQTQRREEWLQDVVAPLLNTVPLRIPVDMLGTFRDLIAVARRQASYAMAHANISFDEVLAVSGRTGSRSTPTLTSVAFQVSQEPNRTFSAGGITFEYLDIHPSAIDLDCYWDVRLDSSGGSLLLAYATELFRSETIARMADEFLALAEALLEAPGAPLCQVSYHSTEDTARAWAEGEGPPLAPTPRATVHEMFTRVAAVTPDATAVVHGEHAWTYAELDAAASQVAERLREAGVGRGAVVALALPRSRMAVAAMLGILRVGAVYLPLDPEQPARRTRATLAHVRPTAVLAATTGAAMAREFGWPVVTAPTEDSMSTAPPVPVGALVNVTGDDLCYVMCTSGTTGEPKAVEITHRGVLSLTHDPDFAPLGVGDVVLQVAPTHFDASTFEIWGALLNGATLVLSQHTRLTGPDLAELVRRHEVTTLHLTAGLLRVVAEGSEECFVGLRTLLTGGDVVPAEPVRRLMTAFPGLRVVACYGPTENTTFSMVEVLDGLPPHAVPLGQPLAGRSAHLLDAWMRPVPPGATGEIYVGGSGLARGYVGDPGQTTERFVPHPARPGELLYRTGDLARRRWDGTWHFLGRRDHQVKIRGIRVEPAEVETALLRHSAVEQCLVRTRGDAGDRSLVAYAVAPATTPVRALRDHLVGLLPAALVPTGYVLLDTLPLTAQGKVDIARLDLLPLDATEADGTDQPLSPTELTVRSLWCAALGLEAVSVRTDFFEAGGHSLAALKIAGWLEREFHCRVPVSEVLRHATVGALARWLDADRPCPPSPPEPLRQAQDIRPSVPRDDMAKDLASATDEEIAMLSRLVPGCTILTEGSRP